MSVTYPITNEQKQILDRYTCERLTADPENKSHIYSFYSRKGRSLAYKLQADAWQEDLRGYPVYYVVKDPNGQIVMYFSLKCGVLFDRDSLKSLMEKKERYDTLINSMGYASFTEEMRKELLELYHEVQEYEFLQEDMRFDTNKSMIRVVESYPAVELVHWCLNDHAREEWRSSGMGSRTMGETLFWCFIVPKVLEIANLVGCQYLYTFVADGSSDSILLRYFDVMLHFMTSDHLGTAKPAFDFMCPMMYQRIHRMDVDDPTIDSNVASAENIHGIAQWQEEFFEHFNIDPGSRDFV